MLIEIIQHADSVMEHSHSSLTLQFAQAVSCSWVFSITKQLKHSHAQINYENSKIVSILK